MEDATKTTPDAPAAVRPILETRPVRQCPGKAGACTSQFLVGSGSVPDLTTLYEQVRDTAVDQKSPLTREEVLSTELCRSCGHDRRFREHGIRMYSTEGTLKLMASWAHQNAQVIARQAEERHRREASTKERQLRWALGRPDDKGLVNKTFAEAGTKHGWHKKKPKRKRSDAGPKSPRDPNAPKNYGSAKVQAVSSSKKKNKKGGKDKDGGKDKNKKGR